jgi:hypothetical protein
MQEIITALSTAISITTKLRELGKKINDAEFSMLLADLSLQLSDVKMLSADIKLENASLKEKIMKLENKIALKDTMVYSEEFRAYMSKSGEGPFCTRCYDEHQLQIRLREPNTMLHQKNMACPRCLTEH